MGIKNIEPILQFMLNNKFILPIMFIAFVIQFIGLQYLIGNSNSDFSYSGHTYDYFERSFVKTIVAVLALILGVATFGICCFYIKIN